MIIEEMQKRRKALGLTYEDLAETSGVPLSTVQKILGGFSQNPNYRTVLALEEVFRPEQPFYHIDEEPYPMVREARTSYLAKKVGPILSRTSKDCPMACAANCGMEKWCCSPRLRKRTNWL